MVQSNSIDAGGVGYCAPAGVSGGAQAKVDAAMGQIDAITSEIGSIQSAIAIIQEAIAVLQAGLAGLKPPDPSKYKKTEQRKEGTPPSERTVTVQVFDSAAYNAAMSQYLSKVQALQSQIQSKKGELATKEAQLAQKTQALATAKANLTAAQQELERALAQDAAARQAAQQRYQEEMRKAQQAEQDAIKAQAEAQKAQDDLQKANDALQRTMSAAAAATGGSSAELERKVKDWNGSGTPPFAVKEPPSQRDLDESARAAKAAQDTARGSLQSAANALPRVENGRLVPPSTALSAKDFYDVMPRIDSFAPGAQGVDPGLVTAANAAAGSPQLTPEMTVEMYQAWKSAGFSDADIKSALTTVAGPDGPAMLTSALASSPEVQKAAQEVIDAVHNGHGNAASLLADDLAKKDSMYQSALLAAMANKDVEALGQTLRGVGGDYNVQWPAISADQQQIVADALGSAYENKALPSDIVKSLLTPQVSGIDGVSIVAGVIAKSQTSTQLKVDFANEALAVAFDPNAHGVFNGEPYAAAALRAFGGDANALEQVMTAYTPPVAAGHHSLDEVLKLAARAPGVRLTADQWMPDPIAAFADSAAKLPPSADKLVLATFRGVVSQDLVNPPSSRLDSMTGMYMAHQRSITDSLLADDQAEKANNIAMLSKFLGEAAFSGQGSRTAGLFDSLKSLAAEYRAQGDYYKLGELAGCIENGFSFEVKEAKDRAEAVKGFVELIFDFVPADKLTSFLSDAVSSKLGGEVAKYLADQTIEAATDKAKEAAIQALTDKLVEEDKILFVTTGQHIKSRNDLDALVRQLFEVTTLPDSDPVTPGNQSVHTFEEGQGTAFDAYDGN